MPMETDVWLEAAALAFQISFMLAVADMTIELMMWVSISLVVLAEMTMALEVL